MNSNIKEKLSRFAKPVLLVLALLFGIALIIIPADNAKKTSEEYETDGYAKLGAYTADIETRLEEIIGGIAGAGTTRVMVSFESSFESVYANNAKIQENGTESVSASAKSSEKQIVLAGDRMGAEAPVLLKELCPRVKGVLVVCEGGSIESVCMSIKSAVTALFGISETKVCVTAGLT